LSKPFTRLEYVSFFLTRVFGKRLDRGSSTKRSLARRYMTEEQLQNSLFKPCSEIQPHWLHVGLSYIGILLAVLSFYIQKIFVLSVP